MAALSTLSGSTLEQVVGRIEEVIQQTALGPGGRLPTERRLAEQLGVRRTLIRHALSQLEASGLLSREVGRGTFLRAEDAPTPGAGPLSLTDVAPPDVMATRLLLEPAAVARAVVCATERNLAEMDRCLQGGEAAETYADFESWDCALHRCLVAATHNPLLVNLYATVESARQSHIWGHLKRRNDSLERRAVYRQEHFAIVEAVKMRDPDAAFTAMQRHLTNVSINLFGSVR